MTSQQTAAGRSGALIAGCAILCGLYLSSRYSYLLFHTLVETFSIVVACGVFIVVWNARRFLSDGFLLILGVASLCVAAVDLPHTLAYKGMGVFKGFDANLPTQLWIAARSLQAGSLLAAPFFIGRRVRPWLLVASFSALTALLLASIFHWGIFPDCFVEGVGLTPFKRGSEYVICLVLGAALLLMRRRRQAFDREVLRLLSAAVCLFILSELAFTLYVDVYGLLNMVGHLLKVGTFYCIYRAVIETGLVRPYDLLFRELAESERRYRHLYKETPVMLHSIDREGRVVDVSNHWLEHLGYGPEEVLGQPSAAFLTEESRRLAEEKVLADFFRTGFCRDVPHRVVKKGGEVIDVLLTATAERDERGEMVRSLAVMVDVTERKRAAAEIESLNTDLAARAVELETALTELEMANEELAATNQELETANLELEATNRELDAANRELEAFNYSVSHDLRRPLTNIHGYSQVILELYGDRLDGQCREFVTDILRQAERMDGLIETLLRFSRISRSELSRGPVDLSLLARTAAAEQQGREPERRMTVVVAEGVTAEGDAKLLGVVVENLLGNAWKYTGRCADPLIEFGVTEAGGKRVFFVRDNGVGFSMDDADRLFLPFNRLHRADEFEGHGIGLATVQRIIQRHGGRIWAEGEPGKGATFSFTL